MSFQSMRNGRETAGIIGSARQFSVLKHLILLLLMLSVASPGATRKITIKGYNSAWGTAEGAIVLTDLNGDGKYDFLIRPRLTDYTGNVVAVLNDGTLLWCKPLTGAGSEYYGFTGYDMDGDKKAEVYASGNSVSKVNPLTGQVLATAPGRGQCVIAYLDGSTPSLVIVGDLLEGGAKVTYVYAYDADLKQLWKCTPADGFTAHTACAADVDGDGRDEIVIGAMVIDDNGKVLHSRAGDHVDVAHVADIDWDNPGLEISATPYLLDAKTGRILWTNPQCVGSWGFVGDLDPNSPGLEIVALHSHKEEGQTCAFSAMWSAKGKKLRAYNPAAKQSAVWWNGTATQQAIDGPARQWLQADIEGDWREEMVSVSGATVTIVSPDGAPALNLRSLMTDRKYRCDVARGSRGINGKYAQPIISGRIQDLGKTTGLGTGVPSASPSQFYAGKKAERNDLWLIDGKRFSGIDVRQMTVLAHNRSEPRIVFSSSAIRRSGE